MPLHPRRTLLSVLASDNSHHSIQRASANLRNISFVPLRGCVHAFSGEGMFEFSLNFAGSIQLHLIETEPRNVGVKFAFRRATPPHTHTHFAC